MIRDIKLVKMSSEWRNDLPPKEGYYEAKFGANDTPSVVYLHPFKAGEIAGIDEDFTSWGWDESDDPESVEVECERGDFWWREIQPTPPVPDAVRLIIT